MARKPGPQVDTGCYTRIHNDVLSLLALMPFNARELRIVLHVIRLTWGFNRTKATTTAYDVAAATTMTAQHARAAIASLAAARVLTVKGETAQRKPFAIALNKYAQEWRGDYALPPAAYQFSNQLGERISNPNGKRNANQDGKRNGKNAGPKPARGAASGEPKDMKDMKDMKSSSNDDVGAAAMVPDEGAMTPADPPAPAYLAPGFSRAEDDEPGAVPPPAPPRPGFDMAVKAFLAVYDRGGAVLPPYKLAELRDAIDAVGVTPAEWAAHVQATIGEKKRAGVKLRVSTPSYFVPIIQARMGHTPPSDPEAGNAYASYA